MKTVEQRIEALKKPPPELSELDILQELPSSMTAPSVSNIARDAKGEPNAWLSFIAPSYDPEETHDPTAILRSLEDFGFISLPATLVKWDNWRPTPWAGLIDDVPEKHGCYTFSDQWPMCPLWVSPCQHCHPDAMAFYRSPSGLLLRVSVDLPRGLVGIDAERKEISGGWYFQHGTAKLRHPDAWHNVYMDEESVAGLHSRNLACVDTEQGVSGAIYWEPYLDPFPMTAGGMLAALLGSAVPA